ncbi:MAG: Smr/MutS family protein [Saprospiraceae bacterium]|nr:Smr/MutS family protein [Saprospiraceae bacterium]
MDIKDLWIGDEVFIKHTKVSGRFQGVNSSGKARILIDGKVFLVMEGDLELIPEKEHFPDIHKMMEEEKPAVASKKLVVTVFNTIDLHIEKLAPHMENELPSRILDFERQKCNEFLQEAMEKNYPVVTIIHGIGQGVLKSEIEHLLKNIPQIRFTFSKNNGGAVEVWL